MIRFLLFFFFWTLLFLLLYRVLRLWFGKPRQTEERPSSVQGQPKNKPLDLSHADVEDAKFYEVKKK